MLLGQAEIVSATGLSDFAGKFGFPALLVVILLIGIWKMLESGKDERVKRDERDEKREEARRAEREADRKAHVDALASHTASLSALSLAVIETGRKVDTFAEALRTETMRLVKGG